MAGWNRLTAFLTSGSQVRVLLGSPLFYEDKSGWLRRQPHVGNGNFGSASLPMSPVFSYLELSRVIHRLEAVTSGRFRISARARNRAESAAFFVIAAVFSNDGARLLSSASSLWFMCEFSAL